MHDFPVAEGDIARRQSLSTAFTWRPDDSTSPTTAAVFDLRRGRAVNVTNLANKEYVASCYSYSWCW